MKRTIMASILSATLAVTSFTATPARADEDVAKVLAGLVFLGIVAKALDKDDRKPAPVARSGRGNGGYVDRPHRPRPPRVTPPRQVRKIAPQRCLRNQWTHRGERQVYGARCMKRHAKAQLPHRCLQDARTNNGPRYFYTKRCLNKFGWRA